MPSGAFALSFACGRKAHAPPNFAGGCSVPPRKASAQWAVVLFGFARFIEKSHASLRIRQRRAAAEDERMPLDAATLEPLRWRAKPQPPPIVDSILNRRRPYLPSVAAATAEFGSFQRTRANLERTLQGSRTSLSLPVPTMSKVLAHTAAVPSLRAGRRALPPIATSGGRAVA